MYVSVFLFWLICLLFAFFTTVHIFIFELVFGEERPQTVGELYGRAPSKVLEVAVEPIEPPVVLVPRLLVRVGVEELIVLGYSLVYRLQVLNGRYGHGQVSKRLDGLGHGPALETRDLTEQFSFEHLVYYTRVGQLLFNFFCK